MAMVDSIASVGLFAFLLIMLLLILLLILIACKPWRFFSTSYRSSRNSAIKVDDLERPLVRDDLDQQQCQRNEPGRSYPPEGSYFQTEGNLHPLGAHSLSYKQRISSSTSHSAQGGSLVLDIGDVSEDISVGQTLRHSPATSHYIEEQKCAQKEDLDYDSRSHIVDPSLQERLARDTGHTANHGSKLNLEVITGPSRGISYSVKSNSGSKLPLTLGRVPPSDLVVKDSEVSGKHAMISWNLNKAKWELVDMGSLNGTLLNFKPVNHPDAGSRHWGDAVELSSGDVITLGTSSEIHVQISSPKEYEIPFGVGIASDPMSLRRGAKKLPMEDVCYYRWPLPGTDKFGVFGICDGHGGADAAKSASQILPEMIASILSDSLRRDKVKSQCDAAEVLKDAFLQTESCMNHYYEGCTATVLLVWADSDQSLFAQCANVGDSACVISINGGQIKMTEDHRITSYSERQRINETGDPLKDGDKRLCGTASISIFSMNLVEHLSHSSIFLVIGLNLARMLGDKFLKEQDARFSSKPFISQVVRIDHSSNAFALLASDGLWDVISAKKAVQLVLQARERYAEDKKMLAEKIANSLISEARTLRTKDNTSVVYLDFGASLRTTSCKYDSS